MAPIKKVYIVKKSFEHDGFSYTEGEKYELDVNVVAGMIEGTVEEFIPEQKTPDQEGVAQASKTDEGAAIDEKPAVVPVTPWAGGHSVGRE
jgi:hypothetical protein